MIYPRFQLSLILINAIIMTSTLGVVGLQALRTYEELKLMGRNAHLAEGHPYYRFVELQGGVLFSNLGIAVVVGFAVSTLLTLVVSNRFAGPILRLEKFLRAIPRGGRPVPRLTFRRGDYFDELPSALNEALDSLQSDQWDPLESTCRHASLSIL